MKAEIQEDRTSKAPILVITTDTDAEKMLLNLMLTGMASDGISFARTAVPTTIFKIRRATKKEDLPEGSDIIANIYGAGK